MEYNIRVQDFYRFVQEYLMNILNEVQTLSMSAQVLTFSLILYKLLARHSTMSCEVVFYSPMTISNSYALMLHN